MISCRVYLFTYKRDHLLPRAVQSLIAQTFTNWVCEVHNDCPGNPFPAEYIKSLNDPRFTVKDHEHNLGAVASFNLAFAGCPETYASLLEDDNWWEPQFLAKMIEVMEQNPGLNIIWSNMHLWQEAAGNSWHNTGKTTWPENNEVQFFTWPQPQHALSALHSTGAMLYRSDKANSYIVPEGLLQNAVELIRERAFDYPIAVHHKPLANFAITLSTYRSDDVCKWIGTQVMMLASFIATAPDPPKTFKESLRFYRTQKPTPIANFYLAGLLLLRDNSYYRLFSLNDWVIIVRWLIRNGNKVSYIKKYLDTQMHTYRFLLQETQKRANS